MILVEGLGLCGRPTPVTAGDDSDNPQPPPLREAQLVFGSDGMGRFGHTLPVYPDLARSDLSGCQRPRFEEPCVEQPLINTDLFRHPSRFLSAINAAKGLSGSIGLSRFGGEAFA